jgi:basic membrane protein A
VLAAGCSGQPSDETDRADDTGRAEPTPSATPSSVPTQTVAGAKACLLLISGGFDDRVLSRSASNGLDRAGEELGLKTAVVTADETADPAGDLDSLVEQGCDVVTTVSYLLGDATWSAARKHPDVDFSIVDFSYDRPPENLKGMLFDAAAPAFLAGYLAAGVTETGVIGTFGGAQIPGVTVYMDGFDAGVAQYNDDNGTEIDLLGWDRETQEGTFLNDFVSRPQGQSVAAEMITQGADIIFPVAEAAGLGALRAVRDAGVRAVWAETDGCASVAAYCDVMLTSAVKAIDVAVLDSIRDSVTGDFDNRPYLGTLANGGVGLAPYHQQQDAVPDELDARIDELEQQLVSGDLEIEFEVE